MKIVAFLLLSVSVALSQISSWETTDGIIGGATVFSVAADSDGYAYVSGAFGPNSIIRSTDEGLHWSPTSLSVGDVTGIAAGPHGLVLAAAWNAMYRSTNHGLDWSLSNSGLESTKVGCVTRASSGLLYAGTYNTGLFSSSNNGDTWVPVGLGGKWVTQITSDGSQNLWANVYFGPAYRSTDLGHSWIPMDSISGSASFAPDHNGGVFAGQYHGPIFRTTDAGVNWVKKSNGLPSFVDGTVMTVDAYGNIYAFPYNLGVFRSTDLGDTWTRVDRRLAWTNSFVSANTASGALIVGTRGGGVYRSDDHGTSWKQSSTGISVPSVKSLVRSGNFLLAGTRVGVFRSSDNGRTWAQVDTGFVPFDTKALVLDLEGNIFGAAYYLFRSDNSGSSWSTSSPGNAVSVAVTAHRTFLVVDYYLEGGGTPMQYFTRILRSTDSGDSWSTVVERNDQSVGSVLSLNDSLILSSNMRSTDDGKTWERVLGIDTTFLTALSDSTGLLIAGGPTGVLESTDSGRTWTQVATFDVPVRVLARGPGSPLFAGTEGKGVLASTDLGYTWTPLNTGLNDSTILSMVIAPDGHLVVGTLHGGAFRSADRVTSIEPPGHSTKVTRYALEQNYPNPFNPVTEIRYQVPAVSTVELAVYDVLGRKVATLVDEVKQPGTFNVKWNARAQSSGVYFYKLRVRPLDSAKGRDSRSGAGSFVDTKKLLLLR